MAWKLLFFSAMITVECVEMGLVTLSKAAMNSGMSNYVFVVYYNALGTFILLPLTLFRSSRIKSPPLTLALLIKFFFLGLIGICVLQICAYIGINYSSPTLAAAMGNLIPAITFLLAVALRMEKLDMKESSSKAKTAGAILAISGAFVVILYKGPAVLRVREHIVVQQSSHQPLLAVEANWILGGFFLLITCLSSSIWNIFQAKVANEYPDKLRIVFFYSLFGTFQSAICSFFLERNSNAWKLHNTTEIVAVIYAALSVAVFRNSVVTWCLKERGPVYVAMYKPLSMVIAALMSFMFLGETLYLGSVIGAAVIVTGFYAVTWGQAKEADTRQNLDCCTEPNCSHKTPLL